MVWAMLRRGPCCERQQPWDSPIVPPPSLKCRQPALWPVVDKGARSYVLLAGASYPTLRCPALGRWGAIPCSNPLASATQGGVCCAALCIGVEQRKNGRLKNMQFSLFAHSHAYCHNKSKNWGAPRYKKVTIPLHPKSLGLQGQLDRYCGSISPCIPHFTIFCAASESWWPRNMKRSQQKQNLFWNSERISSIAGPCESPVLIHAPLTHKLCLLSAARLNCWQQFTINQFIDPSTVEPIYIPIQL